MDCTSVKGDIVTFAGGFQVRKMSDPNQISVGAQGIWQILHKRNYYTVEYNANGGSGTMVNSSHKIGEAKNLNANWFTRVGYNFLGWAISSTGPVAYTDRQSVTNLSTTADATVTLYAVWHSWRVSLSETGLYTFADAIQFYDIQTARNVVVNNMGNQVTGTLNIILSGSNASSFTLSSSLLDSIDVGGNANFTVVPRTGLSGGTNNATVTVSGSNSISASFNVRFTVIAATWW
jgi:hypothetical protein